MGNYPRVLVVWGHLGALQFSYRSVRGLLPRNACYVYCSASLQVEIVTHQIPIPVSLLSLFDALETRRLGMAIASQTEQWGLGRPRF